MLWWVFLGIAAPLDSVRAQLANERIISPVRLTEAPQVDGQVAGEGIWQGLPVASDFVQTAPDEGLPSSQRTEVRVGYTDDTLFFGIICFDDDPDAIVISDSRRDSNLVDTDSLRIVLDTYRDGQNGFVFGTNPAGLEYDGQVTREGSGGPFGNIGRQAGGAGGGFNINWDGAWIVKNAVAIACSKNGPTQLVFLDVFPDLFLYW